MSHNHARNSCILFIFYIGQEEKKRPLDRKSSIYICESRMNSSLVHIIIRNSLDAKDNILFSISYFYNFSIALINQQNLFFTYLTYYMCFQSSTICVSLLHLNTLICKNKKIKSVRDGLLYMHTVHVVRPFIEHYTVYCQVTESSKLHKIKNKGSTLLTPSQWHTATTTKVSILHWQCCFFFFYYCLLLCRYDGMKKITVVFYGRFLSHLRNVKDSQLNE